MSKNILILSTGDFREKGIQVGFKTPEGYRDNGWNIYYIVARDNCKYSHYIYEKTINISGINIERFELPLTKLRNAITNNTIRAFLTKLVLLYTSILLAIKSLKYIKNNNIKIIYGYETYGIISIGILSIFGKLRGIKKISRFLGTWIYYYIKNKKYIKLLLNIDVIIAFKIKVDLFIMTNDGTQGNKAIEIISKYNYKRLLFITNGVNELKIYNKKRALIKKKFNISKNDIVITSISRLEKWKGVNRIIEVINILVNQYKLKNILYFLIGDGNEKQNIENLISKYKLKKNIICVGAINNNEVKTYYNISEYFFSTYDLSNLGNPLLEAIRSNLIIFTLNNGDTKEWIKHKTNGFIYNINQNLYQNMAEDFYKLLKDKKLKENIILNIKYTEKNKLLNWEQRMKKEIKNVEKLIFL